MANSDNLDYREDRTDPGESQRVIWALAQAKSSRYARRFLDHLFSHGYADVLGGVGGSDHRAHSVHLTRLTEHFCCIGRNPEFCGFDMAM